MSAEDISKLLESVCKQSQVSSNLSSYLPPSMQPPLAAGSVQQDSNGVCVKLVAYLTGSSHDPQLEARVAETFASLAREEGFRDVALQCGAVPPLTKLLESAQVDVQLQAMRALGNLCFDHDGNREQVLASGGCPCLVELLTRYEQAPPAGMDEGQMQRLKTVTCGCLLNIACDNDELCGALLGAGVVEALSLVLSAVPGQSQAVVAMALQVLNTLLDSKSSDLSSLASTPLSAALVQCCSSEHSAVFESLLEALHTLVENDKCKVCLVQAGIVQCLLKLKGADEQLRHKAVDLITLLLAEDECLEITFKKGKVLEQAMKWIHPDESDLTLKASAALMIANMARSDANCSVLVSVGVVPLLIALTRIDEKEVADRAMYGKFHTAAFSALRNLSLPAASKEMFLKEGVVDAAVHCLRTSSLAASWYKAIGSLRLLVDKQAATCCYIAAQEGVVACVCEVCGSVGPAHLALEGSRLLAALVKNSGGDKGVIRAVVIGGGVKWISSLLEAEHILLLNEALLSLTMLAGLHEDAVLSSLVNAGVVALLVKVLVGSDRAAEILSNGLVLLHVLHASDSASVKPALDESHDAIVTALQALSTHTSDVVRSKVQNIKEQFADL